MQGGEALVHKVLEWEGGPKFVNSERRRIAVQVCMEGGMGGAKVSRDDLEASNQRQGEFVGENVVDLAVRQVGTRSSPPQVEAMVPRSAHP